MRRHLVLGLLVGLLAFSPATAFADEKDITGVYTCVGTNPDGKEYKGTTTIEKKGDVYKLSWKIGNESHSGIGILQGGQLAVAWAVDGGGGGIVVYKVEKGPKLVGKWAQAGGKDEVYTETLTFEKRLDI